MRHFTTIWLASLEETGRILSWKFYDRNPESVRVWTRFALVEIMRSSCGVLFVLRTNWFGLFKYLNTV